MAAFERGDIVRVPFPYTSGTVQQHRPALVVAVPVVAPDFILLWVLMITSAANRGWRGDVAITDFAAAGLPAPSIVRTAKIATIDAMDAGLIGRLPASTYATIARYLAELMP